ncbi:MAG TPA: acetamidase/formamidase family protein [Methylomirabilota bacterium]|jgi:acetamidase/formamidase|nr:acetamidase/formamidase family protein [Methylomirabilota bacterium]
MAKARESLRSEAKHHHLPASPETAHWGFLDPKLKPVLTIDSGDSVTIDCVSGNPEMMPPKELGFQILPEHLEIHRRVTKGTGNHIFTGPIYVEGAEPGDVLEVRVHDIALRQDWGWNVFRPLVGTLPDDFPYYRCIHIPLDRQAMTATMPWGLKIPIRPFFGQLAVAPRPEFGRQNSKEPREFGGNIDCKELTAGSTIYLPVWTKGALFSTGDGHALQGDGEVCGTAIETALTGTFEFVVRKDLKLAMPRAETPTHFITMGLDVDLDDAAVQALRAMIDWLGALLGLSKEDAYSFCSFIVDLHITQTVNNVKGVHAMAEKRLIGKA